ncbi:unnamed protein product [Tilletia caries]|nr:hypothetical protein CF335_g6612 [Tilletia laevis]CAD6892479.1 unnamed protein product [Tilletia caries]CAD6950506.1 unnamed protein product [Tilletia caries]
MAPKKRRDLGDNDEAVAAGSMDPSAVAQGHAQPLGSDDLTPEPTPTPEPEDQQERDAPHNSGQSVAETARPNDDDSEPSVRPLNHFEDMSTEELESELQLAMIRNALIKKKRQEKIQSSPIPPSVPKDSVPQASARHVSILKDSTIPDSDSILHERQNERLRSAGLLPPRASEISEIMNSTDSPATSILGEKPEISRAGIKITGPEKWKGDRSLQAFTDWIHSVAHYFKIHAPLSEQLKINLIGGYLTGDPLDWYWRHVAPHSMQWTATDVMIALRRNFLVDELSRQAADKFERAEQGPRDIHAFQAALLKLADQMTEYPSPIALNRRLINGMNSNLSSAIVANRGIDAELSLWEDIVQAAMDQERAQRYANTLSRGSSGHRNERGDSNTARPAKPQRSGPPPSSARPIVSNNAPKPASGLFRPPVASSSSRQPFVPGTKPSGPKPTDQCQACGAFGHWASECPKRLRANMVDVDDEFQEEQHEHDHEPNDDDEEPNLIFFDTDESLEDGRPLDGEGTDSEGPSSAFNEDNEFIPRCNGISRAFVEPTPIVRESNVSSAKPRFGDPVNSPTKRPPLVNPIVATVYIHGHPAKTLFDSGSTADIISGSFVDLHKISSFKLKEPSPLQLAITGSRGKINRACLAKVTHGACQQQGRYFDILSIDRYDAILGTSYLKDYGAMLDISTNDIIYKIHPGKTISPATYGLKIFKAKPSTSTKPVLSAYGIFNKIKKLPPRAKVSVLNASSLKTVGIDHPTDPTSGVKITKVVCTTTKPAGPSIPSAFSQHLEEHIIEGLSKEWFKKTQDLWGPRPAKLPPFREINHAISLIDEDYRPHCRPAKCPEQFRQAYLQKIETCTKSGVWKRAAVPAAMPMMVIPKKDSRIRTVVDARQRNDNTVKDVTPFPDQDVIRRDVARAKYRSKIDQADFFEQIRIIPEDVWKTAFATPFGTFVSLVAQQGDCNVPSTAQQLMMYLFRLHIGSFVHAYLDDIFIFSDSIEEHEEHLGLVFAILRAAELYLSKDKMDLYSKSMVCFGHVIDEDGLHADEDKLSKIIAWKEMKTVKEVQRFLGLVQYLAQFFPNLTNMTGPISKLTQKGQPFEWRPLQTECLSQLQRAASKPPILKPIDPVHNKEPIFVFSDASTSGVGALYGQGSSWQTMRPAGFHSRKFNSAQMNYRTHEQELLAVLEALMKWEDQLLGRKFILITDHRSLEYLQTQKNLSGPMYYLSRFWEDPTVPSNAHDFVNADARLSRDSEDEPPHLYNAAIIRNIRQRDAPGTAQPSPPNSNKTFIKPEGLTSDIGPAVQAGYSNDPFFQPIWNKPKDHKPTYTVSDGFL